MKNSLDLLIDIRKSMQGRVVNWSLEPILTVDQWKEFVLKNINNATEEQIKQLELLGFKEVPNVHQKSKAKDDKGS